MLPKIQAMALDGVTVECRESTQKSFTRYWHNQHDSFFGYKPINRLRHPGQFEMICYQLSDNSSFLDSEGKFNWDDINEEKIVWSDFAEDYNYDKYVKFDYKHKNYTKKF